MVSQSILIFLEFIGSAVLMTLIPQVACFIFLKKLNQYQQKNYKFAGQWEFVSLTGLHEGGYLLLIAKFLIYKM